MYLSSYLIYFVNHIGDVMVDMFVLSAGFHEFEPRSVKPKIMKLVYVTSPLIT